jgi:two-component system response regulator
MPNRIILLVEDNPDDEELTIRALRSKGLMNPIEVARDGVAALDLLFRRGPHQGRDPALQPALVLLDVKLPKVDGLTVLREVKADPALRTLPVVMLTSSSQDEDIITSYNYGANSYVRKPVAFDEFIDAVGQVGLYWMLLNKRPG